MPDGSIKLLSLIFYLLYYNHDHLSPCSVTQRCAGLTDKTLAASIMEFTDSVKLLIELILDYRNVPTGDGHKNKRMGCMLNLLVCMYVVCICSVCMCVYMCVYIFCVCVRACVNVCMCMCVYMCVYVCVYVLGPKRTWISRVRTFIVYSSRIFRITKNHGNT